MISRFFRIFVFSLVILGLVSVNQSFAVNDISNIDSTKIFSFKVPVKFVDKPVTTTASLNELIPKVSESVVAIDMYKEVPQYVIEYRGRHRYSYEISSFKNRVASGTGFIVSKDGYLLTNAHVVFDNDADYLVSLPDGREFDGKIVYKDTTRDLAIVKISANDLPILNLGNSSDTQVGESVFGIGNAFGQFENVVSTGKVSFLKRDIIALGVNSTEELHDLIETDAPMYPGDSGGPLFDASGDVIGVNVAVSEDFNQSYSIPINEAKKVIANADIDL